MGDFYYGKDALYLLRNGAGDVLPGDGAIIMIIRALSQIQPRRAPPPRALFQKAVF